MLSINELLTTIRKLLNNLELHPIRKTFFVTIYLSSVKIMTISNKNFHSMFTTLYLIILIMKMLKFGVKFSHKINAGNNDRISKQVDKSP